MKLLIKVKEISGNCPVYKVEDKITLKDGYKLEVNETDNLCMHSLGSIMPFYNALAKGISPKELGLSKEEGKVGYIQCPDPRECTGGGTVIFEIRRIND
jgi:uncharacterized repeat protein (TIGR04076 family)